MSEVETERLILRQWRQDDFEAFAGFYADEETARFVGGPSTRDDAWRRMASLAGHWSLRGFGTWAVEEKATGGFVGAVGLWYPEGWPEIELGYWVVRDMQGKGYAKEAARRSRDFAFGELGLNTLVSYIHTDNLPSIRLAEKLGAAEEETIQLLAYGPHHVYRYPKPGA